jgi:hypothetical protein
MMGQASKRCASESERGSFEMEGISELLIGIEDDEIIGNWSVCVCVCDDDIEMNCRYSEKKKI